MRLLLAISLTLNLGIAIWILQNRAPVQPALRKNSATTAQDQRSVPGVRNRSPAKFDGPDPIRWADLESTDYATFIAKLRASGCPEMLVRDIVAMDIRRTFAARARAILGQPSSFQYWKKYSNHNRTPEERAALEKLEEEESRAVQALLGSKVSTQELIDNLHLQIDPYQAELAWLPDDKKDAAIRAFSEARVRDLDLENGNYDLAKRAELLKEILTPEEMADYKLRTSPQSQRISSDLRYADLTLDEFKLLMSQNNQQTGSRRSVIAPASALLTPDVAASIGADRVAEIQRKSDPFYIQFRSASDYYNLPPETADEAVRIVQEANAQGHRIEHDVSLSASDRNNQITAISEAARKQLGSYFGQDGERISQTFSATLLKGHP